VAGILLCKRCKFGEKICYNSGDIEFLLGDCFFLAHPVYNGVLLMVVCVNSCQRWFLCSVYMA